MVRSLCEYQKGHIDTIAQEVPLSDTIHVTGGANMPAVVEAKKRWMRDCVYETKEQSSVKGAALMGYVNLDGD